MPAPYGRGDLVSFSRSQIQTFTVIEPSPADNTRYTIILGARSFTHFAPNGQSEADIAAAIETILLRDQTVFAVARDGASLAIVGSLGFSFSVESTANISTTTTVQAVRGRIEEALRVISTRVLYTRIGSQPQATEVWMILVRAVGREEYEIEVPSGDILTLIQRAAP